MADAILHYIHDPLCGWCYAAEPLVQAVAAAGFPLVLHGGGLWDPASRSDATKRAYIRASDQRIATMTGQLFGAAYLDGLLADPETVWWSRPTIAAVLAGEAIDGGSGLAMMSAIQRAHYVGGLRVVDADILVATAIAAGFDGQHFAELLEQVPVDRHIAETRALMLGRGLQGYPSFLLECDGELAHVAHEAFYGRPEAFAAALTAQALGVPV
ncbi:DsbA family protein [Sphingomonas sp. CGMCC 1.13654]|uniref:DsbA family protein n=1 Tax=Sphingomonas chungangi TaxID=2683589 RepID=A0A838L8X5_9SPHN|nr:DsbA family protein [Sphingomonas chungangi]MBA2935751.1 DsbA family protein [Sphingomonas chungangi]